MKKKRDPKDMVVLAIDVDDGKEAENIINEYGDKVGWGKFNSMFIGAFIYLALTGINLIKLAKSKGMKIFMDLKFHDIPETVGKYARQLAKLGVDMFNLHASGGVAMMMKAVEAIKDEFKNDPQNRPLILAVTILTSIDQEKLEKELGHTMPLPELVMFLAQKAKEAGLDGVVAAESDVERIKAACGNDFLVLTPGMKFDEELKIVEDDQKRKGTPRTTIAAGADFFVMGRSILSRGKEGAQRAVEEAAKGQKERQEREATKEKPA